MRELKESRWEHKGLSNEDRNMISFSRNLHRKIKLEVIHIHEHDLDKVLEVSKLINNNFKLSKELLKSPTDVNQRSGTKS